MFNQFTWIIITFIQVNTFQSWIRMCLLQLTCLNRCMWCDVHVFIWFLWFCCRILWHKKKGFLVWDQKRSKFIRRGKGVFSRFFWRSVLLFMFTFISHIYLFTSSRYLFIYWFIDLFIGCMSVWLFFILCSLFFLFLIYLLTIYLFIYLLSTLMCFGPLSLV